MLVPCPYCGFLLPLIVSTHAAPQRCPRCPRCDRALPASLTARTHDAATTASAEVDPGATAPAGGAGAGAGSTATNSAIAVVERDAGASVVSDASDASGTSQPPGAAADAGADAEDPPTDGPALATDPVTTMGAGALASPASVERTAGREATTTPTPTSGASQAARRPRGRSGTPSFARGPRAALTPRRRWPALLVIAVLLMALAAQLLLVQRAALAANAQWRPLITAVCEALRCELPPWREPAAITMLDRGVQPHARTPGVLSVRASFRNDARWPQPWPTLLLNLSDVDGRFVAHRAFIAREYRTSAGGPALLAPGQGASVQFDVLDPAPGVVAFSFEFR